MDFAFTDEQLMIAETAQQFFAENATSERTRAAMENDGIDRQLWTDFCQELGLGGIIIPEENGGAGLGHVELAVVVEAAGARVAALPLLNLAICSAMIAAGGTEDQKQKWLPKLISGEVIGAAAGNDTVKHDGNTLNGSFELVPHAGIADVLILAHPDQAWIVEKDAPGLSIETFTTMDQTRPLSTITLKNVEGEPFENFEPAMHASQSAAWLCLAAEALGGAQACLDRTVAYSKERVQFGRPIGSFQAYKHRAADMMIEIEQARSAVYWAACAVDEGSDDVKLALHAAKSFCADTFFKCAGDMIQLHGGIGFTWEHDAHLFFKRARSIQTMLLDGNWHREQVATMILGEAA
ncbi:acyl-CoA dehydrogenase family protein [Parasphingorhabdus halotolerans]|uniref:Acyl-CoA/acyl-ACP dehydrogenase n=1 Tax=Parasphingorhabdus halotolerans TaxID=2725558 RepID=A0A6H2DKU1_9SPHN|nr:acyl-CoA dehydrogenase family protein [Parasphingorhabdus halotolerans]QJB68818.1 acyl-CoA/acyl-ACP dehydrogenase [Parasphingorhabdus halotolerans]